MKFCYAPKNSKFCVFKSLYELHYNVNGCQVIDTFRGNETLSSLLIVDYSCVLSWDRKNIQKLHKVSIGETTEILKRLRHSITRFHKAHSSLRSTIWPLFSAVSWLTGWVFVDLSQWSSKAYFKNVEGTEEHLFLSAVSNCILGPACVIHAIFRWQAQQKRCCGGPCATVGLYI